MKKFFSNLALAGLVVLSSLATSCNPEKINTHVDPTNAVVTIAVTAVDASNNNADVSKDPALSLTATSSAYAPVKVEGNILTIQGNPDIKEQVVTIFAIYKDKSAQATVNVSSVLAGGQGSYGATVRFDATPTPPVPSQAATAIVLASVWDKTSQSDVTMSSTFDCTGVPSGYTLTKGLVQGSFQIVKEGGISAFQLTIKAKYGSETAETKVNITDIAELETKTFIASLEVGSEVVTPEPEPAEANIKVTVIDGATQKDVTADAEIKAELPSVSEATIAVDGANIKVTAGGLGKILAQTVTITATYDGRTEVMNFNLDEIEEGKVGNFTAKVTIKAPEAPVETATAVVQISVWDKATEKDVTDQCAFTPGEVPSDYTCTPGETAGTFVITGEGGISAFDFTVSVEFAGVKEDVSVNIVGVAGGESVTITQLIEVGEPVVPAEYAVATIIVNAYDCTLAKDVTAEANIRATLPAGSKATVTVVDHNKVVITGEAGQIIDAQEISVVATYGQVSKEKLIVLPEIACGVEVEQAVTIEFNPLPAYYLEFEKEVTSVEVGTFYSTHNQHTYTHDYTHDYGHGHVSGEWMYNETEFILETTVSYTDEFGTVETVVKYAEGASAADKAKVDYIAAGYPVTVQSVPATLNITVSAFAMYSAFGTKTTTETTYAVIRSEEDKDPVIVGYITVVSVSTNAEYCEAAIPGHEGHYTHGHGNTHDIHGYSSNAGGGIIFGDL